MIGNGVASPVVDYNTFDTLKLLVYYACCVGLMKATKIDNEIKTMIDGIFVCLLDELRSMQVIIKMRNII